MHCDFLKHFERTLKSKLTQALFVVQPTQTDKRTGGYSNTDSKYNFLNNDKLPGAIQTRKSCAVVNAV